MNNRFFFYSIFASIIVFSSFLMVCDDLDKDNPFDPDNPEYIETQIEIIFDSTGIDSLFYTDTPIKVGIVATSQEVMDRIQRVVISFGAGNEFTKEKPDEHPFLELWCDSTHTYTTVDDKDIYVKIVTVNGDDILDSTFVTINGRGALIRTHPQVFSEPFYKKDSLYLSVGDSGTAPITYQWFKDSLITDTSGTTTPVLTPLTGKEQSALIIPVLGFSDSGSYCCGVYNTYGGDTSNASLIRVIPQPPDSNTPYVSFVSGAQQGGENIGGSVAIQLSKALEEDFVTVNVKVGTASSATAGPDFTFVDTVVHFNAGETIQNIDITVKDDDINESNETVILDLVLVENGILGILNSDSTIDSTLLKHTYTIVDNDESFVGFTVLAQSKSEGDTVSLSDSIKVELSNVNQDETTIEYVVDTSKSTATGGSGSEADYTLHGSGTLVFPPYDSIAFIKLDIINDARIEGDQSIFFVLRNPTGGISFSGQDSLCTYYILDDDIVTIGFNTGQTDAFIESDSSVTLNVSLSKSTNDTVSVKYRISGGDADGTGIDYTLIGSSLTFAPGEHQQKITVDIVNDTISEPDETLVLELHDPSPNAILGILDTFTLTILDNEKPTVSFQETSGDKSESETSVTIPVKLSYEPKKQVTVDFTVLEGSTADSLDYSISATPLVFDAGAVKTKNIVLTVVNDKDYERPDETVIIVLEFVENGILGANTTHTHTILDDEYKVTFAKTGNGTITEPTTPTVVVSSGETISPLTAVPDQYWNFVDWTSALPLTDEGSATAATVGPVESDGTVTANFGQGSLTVTVDCGEGGASATFDDLTTTASIPNGGSLGLEATAKPHFSFVSWTSLDLPLSDAGSEDGATVGPVENSGSVTANFVIDVHDVSFGIEGNGTIEGLTGVIDTSITYPFDWNTGTQVIAKPTLPGNKFSSWSVTPDIPPQPAPPSATFDFTVNGNGKITANFTVITYTTSVKTDPVNGSQGTASQSQSSVVYDGTGTFTATPLRGCRFKNWTITGTGTITFPNESTTTVTGIQTGVELTANFEPITAVPGIVYVDRNKNPTSTVHNGSSWYNAFKSLKLATDTAAAGSEFWVAEGTYTPLNEFSGDEDDYITLDAGDTLYGGFTGFENSFVARGDSWKNHYTIISGEIGVTNSKYLIVGLAGSYIDGITVRDAYASPGAVFLYENCKITNSIIRNNDGHGLAAWGANSIIDRCIFTENDAGTGGVGAGIYVQKDNVLIENCIFYNNEADNGGSAVFCDYKCLIVFCTIANNISNGNNTSSGIRGAAGTEVINSVLYGNESNGGDGDQVQISISDVVFHCAITDKNGKGLEAVTTETNNIEELNLVVGFFDAGDPEGEDGYFFTADDGFNLTTSSTDLVDKGYYKTLPDPFSMTTKDILVNNRGTIPVMDIGAYEKQ